MTPEETIAAIVRLLDDQRVPQPIYLDVTVGQELDAGRVLVKRIEGLIFGWRHIADQRNAAEARLRDVREVLDKGNTSSPLPLK